MGRLPLLPANFAIIWGTCGRVKDDLQDARRPHFQPPARFRNPERMNAASPADHPHLLVVDDDARLRGLLQRYLAENGFRVTAAADTAEARALMKGLAFDALVL